MSKAKALKEYVKKIQVIEFNFDWTAVMETLSGWAQCGGGGEKLGYLRNLGLHAVVTL